MSTQTTFTGGDGTDALERLSADDVLHEVRSAARALVRGGFLAYDDVLARCLELAALADDAPRAGTVERVVRHEWDARAAALAAHGGDGASDDARLDAAFATLQRQGLLARASLGDCEECGEREARALARPGAGWVFFPEDAVEGLTGGRLRLAVGAPHDADVSRVVEQVVAALAEHGLRADVEGAGVVVHVADWRRRLPAAA
ncbi:hypothetical protein DNL40_12390 [Xylanimonas oleitrophica]|uniref:DUF6891 domain-containing protein n=1 Tax=Xylanimonas oleitrophica TaxID=2607479 RepID=A0A2W5WMK2_9MICO|nr:hypothetical protein [Xylanimonas oleitrophica]PZR52232.1 hypothetical protein DNL40_12390 [Xylanimonas oleitrophica]